MQHGTVCIGDAVNLDAPLNRDLVSWWLALPGQQRGNIFRDLMMRSHGTLTNGPTWGGSTHPGGFSPLRLDGINDRTLILPAVAPVGEATVAAWFSTSTVATGTRMVFSNHNGSASGAFGLEINRATGGNCSILWNGVVPVNVAGGLSINTFYHLVGVRSGSAGNWTATLYLNGKFLGSGTSATNPTASTETNIGSANTILLFSGLISDVRVYARALTTDEAARLYHASLQGYPTELNWTRRPVALEQGGAVAVGSQFWWNTYGQLASGA